MSFSILRKRCEENRYEVAKAEREMGLDAKLFIPTASRRARSEHPDLRGLPVHFQPEVEIREWRETISGANDILHKEYVTPSGTLETSVRLSDDWPHGDHIPFIDDYQIPRTKNPLITEPADLEALQHLLPPPRDQDIAAYKREAAEAISFVEVHDVLLAGGWGVGMDMANWLCGMQDLMLMTVSEPDFVADLLEMIHEWNMARMEVLLSAPLDLFIRRAWYEGCDFVTPRFYHSVLLPQIQREVELAHEHGARFGYICTSGIGPLIDPLRASGIDVLIGIDPVQGTYTDAAKLKATLGEDMCLWGGVSGAVTVESGTETEVREAVREAVNTLGPEGFVLSPVDNLTLDQPRTWRNVEILIDEWKKAW
jgi:uroporphyrinogen-III decarboxylase